MKQHVTLERSSVSWMDISRYNFKQASTIDVFIHRTWHDITYSRDIDLVSISAIDSWEFLHAAESLTSFGTIFFFRFDYQMKEKFA